VTHPRTLAPSLLVPLVLMSVAGAVIGVQLLTSLGVTPNTALIGALAAMALGRVPLFGLGAFRSIHAQNLAQSAMSAATFGAANSLLLPIGVPYLLGRADLVVPMLGGVALAMFLDAYLLYRLFGSRIFPADAAWPPGLAAAEAIRAGDAGGRQAALLFGSIAVGALGAWLSLPMAAVGTAFIGNIWALSMFGVGLLANAHSASLFGVTVQSAYVPHGMMIGAGLVAFVQVLRQMREERGPSPAHEASRESTWSMTPAAAVMPSTGRTLAIGGLAWLGIAACVALAGGLAAQLSLPMLLVFVLYAAAAAYLHEVIVGLAAMHSGWFPAFAVALITLLVGLLIGFPPVALALLVGFSVATGPAFADMGYDLKAGFVLRGRGADRAFEMEGRREQFMAASVAFATALVVVALSWQGYFAAGLVPPVARVFVTTINAGVAAGVAQSLLLWAMPGALLQMAGGPKRQLGVLLSTGLLITNPAAGWGVLAGLMLRAVWEHGLRRPAGALDALAAGLIAGDALFSFGQSVSRRQAGSGRSV